MESVTATPSHPNKHASGLIASNVEDWVFDLDNTIYPAASSLFPRVARRMTEWIMDHFELPEDEAAELKTRLFRQYGTTMRGLMEEYKLPSDGFLSYVHEIDLSDVGYDAVLDEGLKALPGRKHIYTNGTVRHAERILEAFGIRQHFDVIFDIVASDHVPKPHPAPYDVFVARSGINPATSVMVEDMARNLEPAAALGMQTVWLVSDLEWARQGADEDYVQFIAKDVKDLLTCLLQTETR